MSEPESLVLRILREMRAELGDVRAELGEVRSDIRQIRADFATKSDLSSEFARCALISHPTSCQPARS